MYCKLAFDVKINVQIGPVQSTTGERSKLKVKVRLSLHGIVSVESATVSLEPCLVFLTIYFIMNCGWFTYTFQFQLLEEEDLEVPVVKEPSKDTTMETDEAPNVAPSGASEADVKMQDAKGVDESEGAENGVPESGEKPVQMETDVKVSCKINISAYSLKLLPFACVFLV